MGWIHNANAAVARSPVGRYFRLEGSGVSIIGTMIANANSGISTDANAKDRISSQKFELV